MNGKSLPQRGDLWWILADKRRPAVVVQTDRIGDPRVKSFLVVPLTSRLHLEGLPGNVRLPRRSTQLPKAAVANVYDIQKVFLLDFLECVGKLPAKDVASISEGLRLILQL